MAKGRVFVFQWSQADAEQTAASLQALGWDVEFEWQDGERGSKAARANPPDALVFFMDHKPSHSRVTAEYLGQAKATRDIPMLFVDGEGEQLEKAKASLPSASFISRKQLPQALEALKQ